MKLWIIERYCKLTIHKWKYIRVTPEGHKMFFCKRCKIISLDGVVTFDRYTEDVK